MDRTCGGHRIDDGYDTQSFSVVEYLEQYDDRLNGLRFSVMYLASNVRDIHEFCTGHMCHTAVGAGLCDGDTEVDTVQLTRYVNLARWIVCMSVVWSKSSMTEK